MNNERTTHQQATHELLTKATINERTTHQQATHELLTNATINAGRSIIILSGVAAITLMSQIPAIPELIGAIIWFIWGTVFGSLFFAFTYLTQYFDLKSEWTKCGWRRWALEVEICWGFFWIVTILTFCCGLIFFIIGCYEVRSIVIDLPSKDAGQVACYQLESIDSTLYKVNSCNGEVELFIRP